MNIKKVMVNSVASLAVATIVGLTSLMVKYVGEQVKMNVLTEKRVTLLETDNVNIKKQLYLLTNEVDEHNDDVYTIKNRLNLIENSIHIIWDSVKIKGGGGKSL